MKPLVFISAPFAAPTAEGIAENIRRAVALGRNAISRGYTPIVPHLLGMGGLYGDFDGAMESREARDRAIEQGCALAEWVGASGGQMWIILKWQIAKPPPIGYPPAPWTDALSEGCRAEYRAWCKSALPIARVHYDTWEDWGLK